MPAPSLRIPVALDLDSFKQQTDKASAHVGTALRLITSQFTKANGEIAAGAAGSSAAMASGWLGAASRIATGMIAMRLAVGAAVLAMGAAIGEAIRQLEQMVEIADKANRSNVSAEFFQGFTSEAKKLKVTLADLEGALEHAFQATKDKSPIDVDAWSVGEERITAVEKALRVYNETFFRTQGQQLQGLVLFRDADTVEAKIQAVLKAMIQLEEVGQRAAALDVGERMFGAQFVDNIRRGNTSAQEMLKTAQQTAQTSKDIFSNELVARAKEIDDKLKLAHNTLTENLRPAWDGLADAALTIKNLWAEIVSLTARAASVASVFGRSAALKQDLERREQLRGMLANPDLVPAQRNLRQRELDRLDKQLFSFDQAQNAQSNMAKSLGIEDIGKEPSRGPGAPPTPPPRPAPAGRDRFEASADSIEKRTSALTAETQNINLNTEAREKARVAAELETVAKQINAEAGMGANIVTAEQRQRIDEVAAAYGRAAAAIEQARSPLQSWIRESADVPRQMNFAAAQSLETVTGELANVVTGTKTVSDAFRSMANSIIQDLARIAIRKAISSLLGNLLGGGAAGAGFSFFGSLFGGGGDIDKPSGIGHNAGGTDDWRGGPTWVGEQGPELINLPRGAQVIPNQVLRNGTGGGSDVNINMNVSLEGANGDNAIRNLVRQAHARAVQDAVSVMNSSAPGRQLRYRQLGS